MEVCLVSSSSETDSELDDVEKLKEAVFGIVLNVCLLIKII